MPFNKICVLGLGYIGLPTASTFATNGVKVTGVDINPEVVNVIQNGDVHIHEPGLRTLVQAALLSDNLTISSTPAEADAFIIAVPTPFHEDKSADLNYVIAAAESVVPYLRAGNLVVLESTSPPRTTVDIVAPILEKSGLKAGVDFHLAYSPERVLPGQILRELIENARVIGGIDTASAEAGRDLYSIFVRGEIILTDATTAEMVKLMENTYRDVNIAIANEFARLAARFGVDVWEAISLANRHPRVNVLQPGPGVGGHCISVDPWFLVEAAPDLTALIKTARQVNDSQPRYVLDLLKQALGELLGKRVALLGLSYKANVDDLRESPAITIGHLLQEEGSIVAAFEPHKIGAELEGLLPCSSLEDAIREADALVLTVAHDSLKRVSASQAAQLARGRVAIDLVNGWNKQSWEEEGFRFFRLGDGQSARLFTPEGGARS
jgi:UDP-N-acetyl-D-mannosaminuronic acid dehydrogenase